MLPKTKRQAYGTRKRDYSNQERLSEVAEWVKRMKAYKAEQLERMRNSDKCDFEFQF